MIHSCFRYTHTKYFRTSQYPQIYTNTPIHICTFAQPLYMRTFFKINMTVIAISNQKGGVGKTTISFNLSQILSIKKGTRVLVIDNDPQGNLTASFLANPTVMPGTALDLYDGKSVTPIPANENLFLIGSDISLAPVAERDFQVIFKLKESIKRIKSRFDYILIDCLPSFGHLHFAALNAADYVLIPVNPSPFSRRTCFND